MIATATDAPTSTLAARLLSVVEALLLIFIIVAFWHASPNFRDDWVWLLWIALPIFGLRVLIHRRLWTHTPLDWLLATFLALTVFNYANAPYARRDFWVLICRPLSGIWIYLYMVDHARQWGTQRFLLYGTVGMGTLLGTLALTGSQWQYDKLAPLDGLARALPSVDYDAFLPTFWLSFNPNEVAGALSYIVPLLAALALAHIHTQRTHDDQDIGWQGLRVFALVGFVLAFTALFFGQSRFALAGVLGALIIVIWLLVPHGIWRYIALGGVALMITLQAALLFNWIGGSSSSGANGGISERDERTFTTRFELWQRGWAMMIDYPLTGVGMSMYRTAVDEPRYQIDYYRDKWGPPHAHNEWMQMAADLGAPGLLLFLGWQSITAWMLWRGWRSDVRIIQVTAVAVAGGLLAHGFYALGDAVTLWDRYYFLFWWLLGLAGGVYVLAQQRTTEPSTTY